MSNIAVFDTREYDKKFFDKENEVFKFNIDYFDFKLTHDTAILTKGYEIVCIFVNDIIDSKTIEVMANNGVKLLALRCSGYNNVDLEAALSFGIKVVRVPAYSPYAVAEYALSLLLTLNRKVHRAYIRTREFNFSLNNLVGFTLHNKTIGVIGTGAIGQCFIKILSGFGAKVLAYDLYRNEQLARELDFEYVDMSTIYKNADIISLHCPLSEESYHMFNKKVFKKMKNNAIIINTSRGALINTEDLIYALKQRVIGGAALDVYEEESEFFFKDISSEIMTDDILARLTTFPNVLLTSHQAFLTEEALSKIANTTLNSVKSFYENKLLKAEICHKCTI